ALALGLHALVDGLAVLLRKIDAADAHVDHLNTKWLRVAIELIAHLRHQILAAVAYRIGQRCGAEHAAQRRAPKDRKLRISAVRADRLIDLERVGDAVTCEGIDDEPLAGLHGACDTGTRFVLTRGDHFLRRGFDVENALVDIDDGVDERDLRTQSRLGDDADGLT